jgi:hypothetical protein
VLLPLKGTTVSDGTWLDAAASSPIGIASVTFEMGDGRSQPPKVISSAASTLYGWIGGWNTTGVHNGTYTIRSVATDDLGQSTTSAGVTIKVDNPAPTTSVLIPSNGGTVSGGSQVLDAIASDNVTSVSFRLNGKIIATATSSLWGWYALWNTAGVPNGTYTLQSVASYAGGVTGTSAPILVNVSN